MGKGTWIGFETPSTARGTDKVSTPSVTPRAIYGSITHGCVPVVILIFINKRPALFTGYNILILQLTVVLCTSNVKYVTATVTIIMADSITEAGEGRCFNAHFTVFFSAARCISSINT